MNKLDRVEIWFDRNTIWLLAIFILVIVISLQAIRLESMRQIEDFDRDYVRSLEKQLHDKDEFLLEMEFRCSPFL